MTDLFAQPKQGSANPDNAAYSADGKPDRYGRYKVPHPQSGRMTAWTRATTFAKTISDTYKLNLWGRRITAVGLSQRPDLLDKVRGLDVREDRATLDALCEQAAEAAGSKSAARVGTALHSFTEAVDRGEEPFVPAPWDRNIAAYSEALRAEGITVVPGMIEGLIVCKRWSVAGTFDRVVDDPEQPCSICGLTRKIGDVKTGRDLEYGWLEITVQLAVYANADAVWDKTAMEYTPMPEVCQHRAVVMHLPELTAECTIYDVDIDSGARFADLCEAVRGARKARNLALPRAQSVALAATPEGTATGVPAWEDRIDATRVPEELSAIWTEAIRKGQWTKELEARGMARLAQIKADAP